MESAQHTPTQSAVAAAMATPLPPSPSLPPSRSSASTTPLTGSIRRPASSGSHTRHASAPSVTPSVAARSLPSSPTSTPATSTATPVLASVAPRPQNQNAGTQPPKTKSYVSRLWDLKVSFYALAIVALTDGLALTAPSTESPLGSITYTNGVLVLSILSLLTGYALSAAAETAWDRTRFKRLSKLSGRQGSGQSLLVFWTLSSDVGGSCLILWRELKQLFRRKSGTNTQNANPHSQASTQTHARGHPKFWSTARIISWAVMQFPGVIIMTIVNSTTSYVPVQWTAISGGLGVYDPKLAVADAEPILITDSALNILQDARRAVQVDPINSDCIRAGSSCKSFLLPGGLEEVAPWPYQKLNDSSLDVYVTKGGPAYQIDFWDAPANVTIANDACTVYAASEDEGFQLCASSYAGGTGQIVAGWTPCTATILPSGECNQTGSWGEYVFFSTILSISRRTAKVSMSRDTGTILAWEDLGAPELQNITATDFKTAFDVIIIPWHKSSSSTSPFDFTWLLTAQVASTLYTDLAAPASSKSWDLLHNLFATPLFVFNNVTLGPGPDITTVQPHLLHENYINGSYARTRIHAVPQRWTVLTYVASSGLFLLIIFVELAFSAGYKGPESSMFPFVDSLHLQWVVQDEEMEDIRHVFQAADLAEDEKILERAAGVRVRMRSDTGATASHADT